MDRDAQELSASAYLRHWYSGELLLSKAPPSLWLPLLMNSTNASLKLHHRHTGAIYQIDADTISIDIPSNKTGCRVGVSMGRSVELALLDVLRTTQPRLTAEQRHDLGLLESKLHGAADEVARQQYLAIRRTVLSALPPSRWDF